MLLASTAFAGTDFDGTMAAAKEGEAYAQYNLGVMINAAIVEKGSCY